MKRTGLRLALFLAPLLLAACGRSYDMYRTGNHSSRDDDDWGDSRTSDGEDRPHSRARPGAQVMYSSEVQGGSGPGSYGGRSSTVITPRDGGVQIDHEEYGR